MSCSSFYSIYIVMENAGLLPGSVLHGYALYYKMQRACLPVNNNNNQL